MVLATIASISSPSLLFSFFLVVCCCSSGNNSGMTSTNAFASSSLQNSTSTTPGFCSNSVNKVSRLFRTTSNEAKSIDTNTFVPSVSYKFFALVIKLVKNFGSYSAYPSQCNSLVVALALFSSSSFLLLKTSKTLSTSGLHLLAPKYVRIVRWPFVLFTKLKHFAELSEALESTRTVAFFSALTLFFSKSFRYAFPSLSSAIVPAKNTLRSIFLSLLYCFVKFPIPLATFAALPPNFVSFTSDVSFVIIASKSSRESTTSHPPKFDREDER